MNSLSLRQLLQSFLALSILVFYFVPYTVFSNMTLLRLFPGLIFGYYSSTALVVEMLFAIAVWASYGNRISGDRKVLWLIVLVFLVQFPIAGLMQPAGSHVISDCAFVLSSLGLGLLAARLGSSPDRVVAMIVGAVALQSLFAVAYYLCHHNVLISGTTVRAGGTFSQPNCLAMVTALALPLALVLAIRANHSGRMIAWMLCFSAIFAALILTWERGAILSVALAIPWLLHSIAGKRSYVAGAAVFGLALCVMFFAIRMSSPVDRASTGRSNQSRLVLWNRGMNIFRDHWATGVGVGAVELPVEVKSGNRTITEIVIEPKNLYIHWLDEMGMPGGFLLLAFVIFIVRIVRSDTSLTAAGIGATWIVLAVSGLFDTPVGTAIHVETNALIGALIGATMLLQPASIGEAAEYGTPVAPRISALSEETMGENARDLSVVSCEGA